MQGQIASAKSAIHFGTLSRAFSARLKSKPWGAAPGCFDIAPLALNTPSEAVRGFLERQFSVLNYQKPRGYNQ